MKKKKAASFHGKSMKPGGGGKFAKMVAGLEKSGKSVGSSKAIAAAAGRAKYGKKKFGQMAAKGKHRAAAKKVGKALS